jgi:protein-tyrosine phosphatase
MVWVELEGAVNVRDLGGLPTVDGSETAPCRLLRGDNLQELSPADVTRLVWGIGLTTVVDLRSTAELVSEGPGPLRSVAAVRHLHLPVLPEKGLATDVVSNVLVPYDEQDRGRYPADLRCAHYLGYLESRPDSLVAALRSIANCKGAALVHCAAGKDRTAVVAALALTAVGVLQEAVVSDYAASGQRIDALMERLRRSPTYAWNVDNKPADSHRPRPETMTAFLAQVNARYGGVGPWLTANGFSSYDMRQLRIRLCRP